MSNKVTVEDFIQRARQVHGDKYDYSKLNYVNIITKACIVCPEHGEFWQYPYVHLKGSGCPECGKKMSALKNKLTTDEFIEKAKKKHGDKYDYSKVKYVDIQTPVCIICPEHGEFWQRPSNHIEKSGCPECGRRNIANKQRNSLTEFIEKARKKHGDKYDYSKVKYVNGTNKVCIICPIHGEFWQIAKNHLNGCGCPKCQGYYRTTNEFIKESNLIHNNKYNYSKVEYVDSKTPVCIICPEHGEFWQVPGEHLRGSGCPKCQGLYRTSGEFIEMAHKLHGDKYDYSKVNYIDRKTKVCIICPKHGEFWATPNSHLSGHGCPKCGNVYKPTTEEWIQRAIEVHGDKYDYSKANYIDGKTKLCIICPEHGEFWQIPQSHLKGCGCPKCSMSTLEKNFEQFLINNNINYEWQKQFTWLRYKNKLRLDFYLPDYNIAIECQGEQHGDNSKSYKITEEQWRERNLRDKLKKELCLKHNIRILYYSENNIDFFDTVYTDKDELLNEIKKFGGYIPVDKNKISKNLD